jgi:branched-chain amino acid transport system ATP-binding protein
VTQLPEVVPPLLEARKLSSGYGDLTVLHEVDISVRHGEMLAIIGANAAGKTTLLRTLAGFIRPSSGETYFAGQSTHRLQAFQLAQRGMALVGERAVLPKLSVHDNLVLGAYTRRARPHLKHSLASVLELFPVLAEKRDQMAGLLSGGQQQMVCIGRALMSKPELLMLDEPSAGLSPLLVTTIFRALQALNKDGGLTILLVEQNVHQTLSVADRAYVLENGVVAMEGSGDELIADERVKVAYLGM